MKSWISVKKKLPEENVDVLVYYNNKKIAVDFFYISGFYDETEQTKVTHWMPLPNPPEGKELDKLTETQKMIVVSMAKNGFCESKVARELHFNHNTVRYHIEEVKRKTELDPRDFYDMQKLLKEVEE